MDSKGKDEPDWGQKMNVVTVREAQQNLAQLIYQTVSDVEPTIVVADEGAKAVFVSLDEYNSWQETIYLLSTPANAAHLRRSIAEARAGEFVERPLATP